MLRAAHGDSVLAGHHGIHRTYAAVSYAYYWPGLFADLAHFVRSCRVCAKLQNCWVHRDVLMVDVAHLVSAFDTNQSIFKAHASTPKRATKGNKTPAAPLQPR